MVDALHYRNTVKRLYYEAFPKVERFPWRILLKNEKKGTSEFLVFLEAEKVVGMSYVITGEEHAYLFYFAINKDLRGSGYGSKILKELQNRYQSKNLFLAREVLDPKAENYECRVKRKSFYERNGFHDLPGHIMEAKVTFDIMGNKGRVFPEDYKKLVTTWGGRFMIKLMGLKLVIND